VQAAITAPDPDINNEEGRGFLERSMRLLEQCSLSWPMPGLKEQIDALREAFSADLHKPFVLKAGFPMPSPTPQSQDLPVVTSAQYRPATQLHEVPLDPSSGQVSYNITHPLTPPISIVGDDLKTDSPNRQPLPLVTHHSSAAPATLESTPIQHQWNPTRIFE
jgi:hypothetical protein